jgi:hypothetical protein
LIRSCKEDLAREFEMKDMGLMHYFLGWKYGKVMGNCLCLKESMQMRYYKEFHMESCKPMETPLATNWRKEDATSGEEVDATIYQKLVGSLMYLVNT